MELCGLLISTSPTDPRQYVQRVMDDIAYGRPNMFYDKVRIADNTYQGLLDRLRRSSRHPTFSGQPHYWQRRGIPQESGHHVLCQS